MKKMVDSKKQKISVGEILLIAAENIGDFEKYGKKVAIPAIMAEMSAPNTHVAQFGNTVFVIHKGKNDTGFFRALNADTAPNYLENSYAFLDWAHNVVGMKIMATQFKDPTIFNLFNMISMNPPWDGMWYQAYKMKSGDDRIILGLEPVKDEKWAQ